uniref:Uncharacterized protein n=1 Tax=Oryza barthii TaxID=65489 RepID=A0A0D3EJ12_9ORYZ
ARSTPPLSLPPPRAALPLSSFLDAAAAPDLLFPARRRLPSNPVNYRLSKRGKRRDLFWTFEAYGRQDAPPCIISRPYRF